MEGEFGYGFISLLLYAMTSLSLGNSRSTCEILLHKLSEIIKNWPSGLF